MCYACPEDKYSFEIPSLVEVQECKNCPQGALYCEKDEIKLENGYWR